MIRCLIDFGVILGSMLEAFWTYFWYLFRNSDFMKMSVSLKREHHFQGLEAPEIDQKSIRKLSRKLHRFLNRCFMVFGSMLEPLELQKGIEIGIDFGIDF